MKRRNFLAGAGGALFGSAIHGAANAGPEGGGDSIRSHEAAKEICERQLRAFNEEYRESHLENIAFPLGGIGAGMVCLEGSGALSNVSLRHRPDLAHEPGFFAALCINGESRTARVIEGPVAMRKRRPSFDRAALTGKVGALWGLPRFKEATFKMRFPFAEISLHDEALPVTVNLRGWSPFEPNDADNSSLPVASLEYEIVNLSDRKLDIVFSVHSDNFMKGTGPLKERDAVQPLAGGFQLLGVGSSGMEWDYGGFAAWVDDMPAKVNTAWSSLAVHAAKRAWDDVLRGAYYERASKDGKSPGASLFVPLTVDGGQTRTVVVKLAWFVKRSNLRKNGGADIDWLSDNLKETATAETYSAWYTTKFENLKDVVDYWKQNYHNLRNNSLRFMTSFYDSTLPPEVIEAVSANLPILKSTTVLRQADGRLWGWEGCLEDLGASEGTCTHVWNYAQALPHLFSSLERTLRATEFWDNQTADGHQDFRAAIPIRPISKHFLAAADGQLGGIIKVYRDWRICADVEWLKKIWPRVKSSIDYCIKSWDPDGKGWIEEQHHTTFDTELWGADSMCSGFYLGALSATVEMGRYLHEDVRRYEALLSRGIARFEGELFNGEYFIQQVKWKGLKAKFPDDYKGFIKTFDADLLKITDVEGPPFQYGDGCLAVGSAGLWLAQVSGLGNIVSLEKTRSHLQSVYRYNFKRDLSDYSNPTATMRAYFGYGDEGGVVLCEWPRGRAPTYPIVQSNEVWTGNEYMVAAHAIMAGLTDQGLDIVRTCRRRYDGRFRNPFDEVEAGHWYVRAMSSYSLLQALSGARYDAVTKTLYLTPALKGDFRCFLSTATGYGTVGVRDGKPFLKVACGEISYNKIEYTAANGTARGTPTSPKG